MLLLHNNNSMCGTCDLSALESHSEFWEGAQQGLPRDERIDRSDEEIEKREGWRNRGVASALKHGLQLWSSCC